MILLKEIGCYARLCKDSRIISVEKYQGAINILYNGSGV